MQEEQELLRYWKPRIYKTEPVRTGKGDIDVSILIPVHNAMPYLYECLLSVLSQKRDGIRTEIILCDDHSDKETKSVKLLKAYMSEPYTFHLNHNIAVLQRSLQEDTDMFAKGIIHFMELLIEIIVCVVLGIYLFIVSKSITVIVLAVLILTVLISTKVSKHVVLNLGKKAQLYKGKLYQWMNQALSGIKEIKVLNRENYFTTIYEDNFDKYTYGLRLTRLVATTSKIYGGSRLYDRPVTRRYIEAELRSEGTDGFHSAAECICGSGFSNDAVRWENQRALHGHSVQSAVT